MKKFKIILRALVVSVDFLVFLPFRVLILIYLIAYAIYGKLRYEISFTETLSEFKYGAKKQSEINMKWTTGEMEFKNYHTFGSRKEQ